MSPPGCPQSGLGEDPESGEEDVLGQTSSAAAWRWAAAQTTEQRGREQGSWLPAVRARDQGLLRAICSQTFLSGLRWTVPLGADRTARLWAPHLISLELVPGENSARVSGCLKPPLGSSWQTAVTADFLSWLDRAPPPPRAWVSLVPSSGPVSLPSVVTGAQPLLHRWVAMWLGTAGVPPVSHADPKVWCLEFTAGEATEDRGLAHILE